MNGLFAVIEKEKVFSSLIQSLMDCGLKSLSHRGSSGREIFIFDEKQLVNTREPSVLVLFSVATCFSVKKGEKYYARAEKILMVFEGKLFNREQLIESLHFTAAEKISLSDVDIAIALFIEKGKDAFALLEGYWSLIVVNMKEQKIYAARDHFGNRPLYYCKTNTQFGIASESRALFSTLKDAGKINRKAVFDYLLWGDSTKHKQNFFSDIHELRPSSCLIYSLNDHSFEEQSYYVLPYKNCKGGYNEYEEPFYIDKTRQLIFESVNNHIWNKNKIAIGLSGGVDSSTLLCVAKKLNPDIRITAFTSTDYLYGGEVACWAEKVVKHTNVDWIKVPCISQHVFEYLGEVNRKQNIPVFNANAVAQYKVMETAKHHGFDTIMDGQGSDELFGGYAVYFLPFLQSLRSQWMFKDWMRELLSVHNTDISYRNIMMKRIKIFLKKYYCHGEKLAKKVKPTEYNLLSNNEYEKDNLFAENHVETVKTVLNDYLYESYTTSLPYVIRWGEQAAASFGMDCVMPFSDSIQLAECIFSIPSTFKIHKGWSKYLLRSSMEGIVPDEIRWRKQKSDYYVSERKCLNEIGKELRDLIYQLEDTDVFVDMNVLMKDWGKLYTSNNYSFQQFVFRHCSYLLWRNEFKKELH
jgi:asparagine synthase (glutamine-hydrolysing)